MRSRHNFYTLLSAAAIAAALLLRPAFAAAPTGITCDQWGVPTVTAPTLAEASYKLGWVTAQDRLLQLDLSRRKAAGRLAEFAGKDYVQDDLGMRRLNMNKLAQRDLEHLRTTSNEAYTALVEYSRGINDYVTENGLPDEYFILPRFEPWQPSDTLLVAQLMHLYLSGDSQEEFYRMDTRARGGEFPAMQQRSDAAMRAYGWTPSIHETMQLIASAPSIGGGFAAQCSNAFVVSGKLTADGKPIVCGDPHLDITFPCLWYEVILEVPGEMRVHGMTIPGTCLVSFGDNGHFAWGVTALQADNEDVMIVPKAKAAEVLGAEPQPRQEIVRYRDGIKTKDETATVLDTAYGPVVRDDADNYYILRWTGQYENNQALGFLLLDRGKSMDDFRAAMAQMATPYNFVVADDEGNIGYFAAGQVPIRDYDCNEAQLVDTPEKAQRYNWRFIPPEQMPSAVNPASGYFVTSNDPPALTADGTPVMPGNYATGFRNRRISKLIEEAANAGRKLTRDDMARIQCDVHSLYAEEMLPPVLKRLSPLSAKLNARGQEALQILTSWNYEEDTASQGAPIYELMRINLFRALWNSHSITTDTDVVLLSALNGSDWVSLSDDELLAALAAAATDATKESGKFPAYGDIHKMPLVCPLPFYLTQQPGLVPADGGFSTVNVSSVNWDSKYLLKSFGPSSRLVMSPGEPGGYWSVIPAGNSGRPDSPNFADQVALYLSHGYKYHP